MTDRRVSEKELPVSWWGGGEEGGRGGGGGWRGEEGGRREMFSKQRFLEFEFAEEGMERKRFLSRIENGSVREGIFAFCFVLMLFFCRWILFLCFCLSSALVFFFIIYCGIDTNPKEKSYLASRKND